jgi:hypothetical protein
MFLNDEGEVLPPAAALTFPPCACGYPQCPDRARESEDDGEAEPVPPAAQTEPEPEPEPEVPDSPALSELRARVREGNAHRRSIRSVDPNQP